MAQKWTYIIYSGIELAPCKVEDQDNLKLTRWSSKYFVLPIDSGKSFNINKKAWLNKEIE